MSFLTNLSGKDAQPLDTVAKIKKILKDNGIETEERWSESNVPHCYSLRVNVAGTVFGSNGKGTAKDFTLASAYGELIERLQLGHIWRSKLSVENGASSSELQSVSVSADSLVAEQAPWYEVYAKEAQKHTGAVMTAEELIRQYADKDGNVRVTPFYCVTRQMQTYLPTSLCNTVYLTSGGAAGNTMEEAMVQAFSEIVERHHKLRVISERIATPRIPDEVIQACPIASEIIEFLRSSGFRVIVKDCSLGTKFPVVCVCLIDTATGRYHTHFGAHPNFDIALQRTLTESFQGRNLETVAKHENFCHKTAQVMDLSHQMTELVKGTSEKEPLFFLDSDDSYNDAVGFAGTTNLEVLAECIDFFNVQGYDILVRDSSCLGFPTYQIIIPGYSEVFPNRLSLKHNDIRYSSYVAKVLTNPAAAPLDALMGFMLHLNLTKQQSNAGMKSFLFETGIPANISSKEEKYLQNAAIAHASYTLGNTKEVIACLNNMLLLDAKEDTEYLVCIKRYLTLLLQQYDSATIHTILSTFHKEETVSALYKCIEQKRNPMDPIVLKCDRKCHSSCHLYDKCQKNHIDELIAAIGQKAKAMDQAPMIEKLRNL